MANDKKQCLSNKRHRDDQPLSVIFHPPTVELGKLGSYFENANNLKGAHDKACDTNSVEQNER